MGTGADEQLSVNVPTGVFAEVLNVFGLRTPLSLGTDDGTDFGLVLTRVEPFRIRFGIAYRWPSEG